MVSVEDAPMTLAVADSRVSIVNAPIAHMRVDIIVLLVENE